MRLLPCGEGEVGYSNIKPPQTVGKGRESPLALVGDLCIAVVTIKILCFYAVIILLSVKGIQPVKL